MTNLFKTFRNYLENKKITQELNRRAVNKWIKSNPKRYKKLVRKIQIHNVCSWHQAAVEADRQILNNIRRHKAW